MSGIIKTIADLFRGKTKEGAVDRYGVLQPVLATGDFITTTSDLLVLLQSGSYSAMLTGSTKPTNKHVEKAVEAYRDYVKALPANERSAEMAKPFSTILSALESVTGNLALIEDNFQPLFGSLSSDTPETALRSSSLIIIGYLEKANGFATWLSSLVEHLTAEEKDLIPPFRTKELLSKASESAEFASNNLHKWNYKHESLLGEVKAMQAKGADLHIQTANGQWIDEYGHDNQFSSVEQDLMTASLRSPIMMAITRGHVKAQEKIELLSSRKDWLTAKIVLEQSKMRGVVEGTPEYKRFKKATDHYADLVSKLEQKIERMRA